MLSSKFSGYSLALFLGSSSTFLNSNTINLSYSRLSIFLEPLSSDFLPYSKRSTWDKSMLEFLTYVEIIGEVDESDKDLNEYFIH